MMGKKIKSSTNKDHPIFWFWSFGQKPLFSQANLLKLAPGLTATTIQNWANRGIVSALIEMKEVRGRRYYDSTQIRRIVLGHRLMDAFDLPPALAMLSIDSANAEVIKAWTHDAVASAKTPDTKMPLRMEWIEQYWFVRAPNLRDSVAVKASGLSAAIKNIGPAIVTPYGRDLSDLAVRAKKLYESGGVTEDEDEQRSAVG
jgi:MerR HTH family regulatory protein